MYRMSTTRGEMGRAKSNFTWYGMILTYSGCNNVAVGTKGGACVEGKTAASILDPKKNIVDGGVCGDYGLAGYLVSSCTVGPNRLRSTLTVFGRPVEKHRIIRPGGTCG